MDRALVHEKGRRFARSMHRSNSFPPRSAPAPRFSAAARRLRPLSSSIVPKSTAGSQSPPPSSPASFQQLSAPQFTVQASLLRPLPIAVFTTDEIASISGDIPFHTRELRHRPPSSLPAPKPTTSPLPSSSEASTVSAMAVPIRSTATTHSAHLRSSFQCHNSPKHPADHHLLQATPPPPLPHLIFFSGESQHPTTTASPSSRFQISHHHSFFSHCHIRREGGVWKRVRLEFQSVWDFPTAARTEDPVN